jgi:uncharacterized protein YicC (UPF0701 family)
MRETTRHRDGFNQYVALGAERSIERLRAAWKGRARAPSLRTLYEWSRVFHWQDRILDMERAAREQDRQAHVEALQVMNERHRKEGLALQQRALERLGALAADDMSPTDAIRALTEGVRLERLAAGAPTEHVQQEGEVLHGQVDLRHFSNEELRRLAELAERRAAGTGEEEPEQPA